jgi:hypothetical protein
MLWPLHVEVKEVMRKEYKILVVRPEGKRPSEVLGVDGWIIIKWIIREEG